jgi:hypothetical protein
MNNASHVSSFVHESVLIFLHRVFLGCRHRRIIILRQLHAFTPETPYQWSREGVNKLVQDHLAFANNCPCFFGCSDRTNNYILWKDPAGPYAYTPGDTAYEQRLADELAVPYGQKYQVGCNACYQEWHRCGQPESDAKLQDFIKDRKAFLEGPSLEDHIHCVLLSLQLLQLRDHQS